MPKEGVLVRVYEQFSGVPSMFGSLEVQILYTT